MRQALRWNPQGKRKRGRREEMDTHGYKWIALEELKSPENSYKRICDPVKQTLSLPKTETNLVKEITRDLV